MITHEWKALKSSTPIAPYQIEELEAEGWQLFQILSHGDAFLAYLRKPKTVQH